MQLEWSLFSPSNHKKHNLKLMLTEFYTAKPKTESLQILKEEKKPQIQSPEAHETAEKP